MSKNEERKIQDQDKTKEFGNIDERAEFLALQEKVKNAILEMYRLYQQHLGPMPQKILKFVEILNFTPGEDNTHRLPYYHPKVPYSKRHNRNECILSVCAGLVLDWWAYQNGVKESKIGIELLSNYLVEASKVKFLHEQMFGDMTKGYYVWKDPLKKFGNEDLNQPDTPQTA